jgi:hypothetical protein
LRPTSSIFDGARSLDLGTTMTHWLRRTRWIAPLLALVLLGTMVRPVSAQDQAALLPTQVPVMQNVFYNVVWGSAVGALLGLAGAVEGSTDKTQPSGSRSGIYQGATIGGLLGLGIGIWLVYAGITFDPVGSTLLGSAEKSADPAAYAPKDLKPDPAAAPAPQFDAALAAAQPAFSFVTAPGQPSKITGFRALVVDLRF